MNVVDDEQPRVQQHQRAYHVGRAVAAAAAILGSRQAAFSKAITTMAPTTMATWMAGMAVRSNVGHSQFAMIGAQMHSMASPQVMAPRRSPIAHVT